MGKCVAIPWSSSVFFLVLFLLWMTVDMWITRLGHMLGILLARRREKIGHEAEAVGVKGSCKARHRDSPRLVFGWSTVKTGHHLGNDPELDKHGPVATKM